MHDVIYMILHYLTLHDHYLYRYSLVQLLNQVHKIYHVSQKKNIQLFNLFSTFYTFTSNLIVSVCTCHSIQWM